MIVRSLAYPNIRKEHGVVFNRSQALSRLIACGLTKSEAMSIALTIQKWVECIGEEETVKKLKTLKDAYLHHLVGQKAELPWFKHYSNGCPKGPFKVLWKFNKSQLFKCWNSIMIYSSFEYQIKPGKARMTARQYAKFIKAVNRKPVDLEAQQAVEVLIENFLSVYSLPTFAAETGSPAMEFRGSANRRAPDPSRFMGSSPEEESVVSSIAVLAQRPEFTKRHWSIYSGVLKGFEDSWQGFTWTPDGNTDRCLSGRIGIIQEPGYKARIVANPYRVHQCAMAPLKDYLFSLFPLIPNDYVNNQDSGVRYVQEMVNEGREVFSIDLSNASDNLPLSSQAYLLKRLGVREDWIDCFTAISSGDWELPESWLPDRESIKKYLPKDMIPEWFYPFYTDENHHLHGEDRQTCSKCMNPSDKNQYFRWFEGQPLGLGPSFASAFLLHHAIVVGCHVACNQPLDYAMVGDDLVLSHKDVFVLYSSIMDSLGVEVSKEKSLVSNQAAEFLSRVILPDMILRGYKWKGQGDNSFWDVARNLGPRSMRLFKPRQRKVLRILGQLPEPYGLGWNPAGRPYWDRLEEWIDALDRVDVRIRSFESSTVSLNRKLYNSVLKFITSDGYPVSAIPEQDIVASLRDVLPYDIASLGETVLPNVDYLAQQIVDMGNSATKEQLAFARKAKVVLSSFSSLEKLCDVTQLVRLERLISQVERETASVEALILWLAKPA